MKSLLLYSPFIIVAAAVGISSLPSPKNPTLTVKYYDSPQKVGSDFYQNPFLNLPGSPSKTKYGTDNLSIVLPQERSVFVYELIGFYKAQDSTVAFRAMNCKRAIVSFGHRSGRERGNAHDFEDIVSDEILDATQWTRDIHVTKGHIYPVRFVLLAESDNIRVLDKIGKGISGSVFSVMPATRVKLADGRFEWTAKTGKRGFFYRAAVAPAYEEQYELAMDKIKVLPKMGYGVVEPSFDGALIPKITVPYATEVLGFISVPFSGSYTFKLSKSVISSLQIGLGTHKKPKDLKIGSPWVVLDKRMGSQGKHILRRGLYYPFRLVILGDHKRRSFDMEILDPKGKKIDLLGFSGVPVTSNSHSPYEDGESKYLDSTVGDEKFRDATFGFIKVVETDTVPMESSRNDVSQIADKTSHTNGDNANRVDLRQ